MNIAEIKRLAQLALPLIAAFLAQKGMQVTDTIMLGWIGPQALAGAALGLAGFFMVVVFCVGTLSAVGVLTVYARGAEHFADISPTLQHGFWMAVTLALPAMVLLWYMPQLFSAIGEDPVVVANTRLLLHGLVWGLPGYLLFLVLREFISAFDLTRVIMLITLCSIPLTFMANYVLIYGKYGLPVLGVAGIGFGGTVVMWLMFFAALIFSSRHARLSPYFAQMQFFKLERRKIKEIFVLGAPSGVLLALDMGMFTAAATMMGYFGIDALAAFQIALQAASLAFAFPSALAMATALQVGHAIGAKDVMLAKRAAILGIGVGLVVAAALAMIFISAPEIFIKLFLSADADNFDAVHQLAMSFLLMAAIFLCFDALQIIVNGALKGLKDTFTPMLISVICYWVIGLGSAYYFAFRTHVGAVGIWYGLTIAIYSVGMILALRLWLRFRREVA